MGCWFDEMQNGNGYGAFGNNGVNRGDPSGLGVPIPVPPPGPALVVLQGGADAGTPWVPIILKGGADAAPAAAPATGLALPVALVAASLYAVKTSVDLVDARDDLRRAEIDSEVSGYQTAQHDQLLNSLFSHFSQADRAAYLLLVKAGMDALTAAQQVAASRPAPDPDEAFVKQLHDEEFEKLYPNPNPNPDTKKKDDCPKKYYVQVSERRSLPSSKVSRSCLRSSTGT